MALAARAWTAGSLLFALISAPAAQAEIDPRYELVLRTYARGERSAAVRALDGLSWSDLDEAWDTIRSQARAAVKCPTCSGPLERLPLKAAVMLHVDADLVENPRTVEIEQPPNCTGLHAHRAGQLAGLLASRAEAREFARRFFVAMARRSQWDACTETAIAWGRQGLDHFPDDADLLLAIGASFEKQARLTPNSPAPLLRDALRYLSRAVAASPAGLQARVHLGRVQWRLGQLEEARHTLESALATGGDWGDVYLAELFLGQVHERAGQADAAAETFRRALALDPESQAAAVSLSQLLLQRGDSAGAHAVMDRALVRERDPFDKHWNYLSNNAADVEQLMDDLREETRQ